MQRPPLHRAGAHDVVLPFWIVEVPSAEHVAVSGTQASPEQRNPLAQSASAAHVVPHDLSPLQTYGAQLRSAPETQAPRPSHVEGDSRPPLHLEPHALVAGASLHAEGFVPSHAPPHCEGSPAHGVRLPRGAPTAGTHLPSVPDSAHASHCPVHADSQQTPSTQKPLSHSRPSVQAAPAFCFGAQADAALQ